MPGNHEQLPNSDGTSTDDHDAGSPPAKRLKSDSRSTAKRQRRELGLMRQNEASNAASFVGSSSGIYFVRSVYSALAKPTNPQPPPETPDQNVVPGEEDQLDDGVPFSSRGLWNPGDVQMSSEPTHFDFDDLQGWIGSYFDNWHTAYPFIRAPSLLQYLEQTVNPERLEELSKINSPQMVMVKSIISISLADHRQSGQAPAKPIPAALVFNSFKDATESIQGTLFTPTSMEVLQAVVSVQLFLVSMLRLNGASRLGGLIVRMAFQMGLHRCPARYPNFSLEEVELRQRLFWTIYCIDRHLCQALGLPLTIRDDDIDVCYFDEERHRKNDGRTGMDERFRMLNFLSKHAAIKGQIVELRNKSIHRRRGDKEQAMLIGAQIDKWRNEFQWYLEGVDEEGRFQFNALHKVILSVLRHECVISLYRPLLATNKKGSDYIAALQTCIHASRSVISILYRYLKSSSGEERRAPLIWPSLTWSVWMSAFVMLHAAIEGDVAKSVAKRLADQSVEVLKHFSQRGSVWPNACAVAIEDLFYRLLQESTLERSEAHRSTQDNNGRGKERLNDGQATSRSNDLLPEGEFNTPSARSDQYSHQQVPGRFASIGIPQYSDANLSGMYNSGTAQVQQQGDISNLLLDHAFNVTGPPSTTLDNQSSIPWLYGPDATAATSTNIFEQFDIPFWMGDDQYASLMGNEFQNQ